MRAIMVMFDSLNRHLLNPYGCTWTKTPNFSRLAERSVTFDRAYAGSLPCMPARRELHTGRYNFLHRSWGPMEPFDVSMPELLKNAGIYTHLISDHQHYWEDGGCTYHHRYNTWEIVRGQEGDCWKAQVAETELPHHLGQCWEQDVINQTYLQEKKTSPIQQVFQLGLEYLEKNCRQDNWFLQLESFDPHEPFHSEAQFQSLYPHEYTGPVFNWPDYMPVTEKPEEVEHCRMEYAALLSMCDSYLGKILDFMDLHDMWKDTMLIVNTDHGFLLSEHGCWGKCAHPLYEEVAHIPLFVWDPRYGIQGERRQALVQTIDIPAALLEFFGQALPKTMIGRPLHPVLTSDERIHEGALFGLHGSQICVTDGRYVYMRDPVPDNQPLYEYTLMPTHMRALFQEQELRDMELFSFADFSRNLLLLKIPAVRTEHTIGIPHFGNRLYDLKADSVQGHPLEDEEIAENMKKLMVRLMKEQDCPKEQYTRMGLEALAENCSSE